MCFVVRHVSNYTTITVGTCNYLLALSFVTPRANVIFKSMLCSLKAGGQGSTKIKGGGVLWERKGPFGYRYLFSRDLNWRDCQKIAKFKTLKYKVFVKIGHAKFETLL